MSAQRRHPDVRTYMLVFGTLLVLTAVTVLVSYWHFPPALAILVGLFIATVKASLVAAFFMHLKGERTLIYGLLAVTAVFMAILFILPITDSSAINNSGRRVHAEAQAAEGESRH